MDKVSTPSKIPKGTNIPKLSKSKDRKSITESVSKSKDTMNDRYSSNQSGSKYNFDSQPKTQQRSSSFSRENYKYKPNISTNRDPLEIHSEFSKVFRVGKHFPEFDKDFGPDGSIVQRELENIGPDEDISAMFQRPNTVIPTIHPQTNTVWDATDTVHEQKVHTTGQLKNPDWKPIFQPRLSSAKNETNYATSEELDSILAKYKNKVLPIPQNEYQVYQTAVSNNYPVLEPGFRHQGGKETTDTLHANHHGGYTKDQRRLSDVHKDHNFASFESSPVRHHNAEDNFNVNRRTNNKNAFPFKETPEGDLLVHPDQVAFESKTLSVLVADPAKVGTVKTEKIRGLKEQDHLVKDIEEVIQKGLSQLYDKHISLSGNQPRLGSFGNAQDNHLHWRNLENEYLDKEIVTMKYSEAKVGTDKLMADMHQRIQYGKNADTHVMIGDKVYPCHSIALEVVSKFFDNLSRPKETVRRIDLPESEVSGNIFPTLMDWTLQSDKGRAGVISKSNVVSLFSAGKYLDISELKSQCVNFLQEKVETNDKHLMHLWDEVKQRPNCQELMVVISSKAALSFQHIYKERKFLNLDVDEIVMLLSSDEIVIESELDVFDTSVHWLLHDWQSRKVFTNQVVGTVRFGLLTPLQLTQIAHSPELSKGTKSQEYAEVLTYGSVKSMIDEGLAYSIYYESYKSQPEEVHKWVECTGIKEPRPRIHPNAGSRNKTLNYNNETTTVLHSPSVTHAPLVRTPSYTIFKDVKSDALSRSKLINNQIPREDETKKSVADILQTNVYEQRSRSHPPQHSSHHHRSNEERPNSREGKYSKTSTLERAANTLGQPMREEDIENLTRPTSRSSSKERDKYKY